MATNNVLVLRTGTGYTVDVTPCDLDVDLTTKDFTVRHAGVQVPNTDYAKTTATTLTYTGTALPSNTQVEIRRKTPTSVIFTPRLGLRVRSEDWRKEFDRITRRAEEYELNGVGSTGVGTGQVLNGAYGVGWQGDTVYAPTRDALYTKIETMASLASPAFTGVPRVPTAAPGTNTTQAASTAYVDVALGTKANLASPAFTGSPTVPTQTPGDNSTRVASTAYVDAADALRAPLANPALTGTPTAPTAALGTNTTQLATTAFVRQHEGWVSVLPAGWTGRMRVRRRADGNIDLDVDITNTSVVASAFTAVSLGTLAAAYRPANGLNLTCNVNYLGYNLGYLSITAAGVMTFATNVALNGNTALYGTFSWSVT